LLLVITFAVGCGGGGSRQVSMDGGGGSQSSGGSGGDFGGTGGHGGTGGANLDGGSSDAGIPQHQQTGQSWTILVYMAADNNLEPFALQDLTEMASNGSTANAHIVVQIDRSAGYVTSPVLNLPDFSGAKRLLVHKDSLEVVQDLGDVDSGNPGALSQFVSWGVSRYPADRTALILWDHGGGWNGYGVDESAGTIIKAPALRDAIAEGLSAGHLPRLSLVVFDACMMATFEIASMVRPYAEYLLASEETIPGHGLDYAKLGSVTSDPTTSAVTLATDLLTGYIAQSAAQGDQASITMSLTDLYALDPLRTALGDLVAANGTPLSSNKATTIGRARASARTFGNQAQVPGVMVDLADLAQQLTATDPAYSNAAAEVTLAVQKAVLSSYHGPAESGSNGLSVYFPLQLGDEDPAYEQVMDVASWRTFLDAYLAVANGGSVAAPSFVNPGGVATAQIVNGNLVVSGTLTAGSSAVISTATLYYGLVDSSTGNLYVLGDTPASYDASTVQASWNLTILRLDQAANAAYGYLSLDVAPDGSGELTIPFYYNQGGGAVDQAAFRILAFDTTQTLVEDAYFVSVNGALGPLTAVTGSTLTSTILVATPDGQTQWTKTAVAFDALTPITPSLEAISSGSTVFGDLVIQNVKGESSFVVGTATAP
jgi:hypothetical protein